MIKHMSNLFAAGRTPKAMARRRQFAVECLEERKVFTAGILAPSGHLAAAVVQNSATVNPPNAALQPQHGTFDGVAWSYTYNASGKSWNLTLFDRQGSAPVTLSLSNNVLYFQSNDISASRQAGPTVAATTGFTGSITLLKNPDAAAVTINGETYKANTDANDKAIVNNTGIAMTTTSQTQTGTTMGLQWRFQQTDLAGDGTLYIQDVKRGSDSAVPYNDYLWINQQNGHVVFDVDASAMNNAAAVAPNARVAVVVANNSSGDIGIKDDRGSNGGGLTDIARSGSGNFQEADDVVIPWSYSLNIVTMTEDVTIGTASDYSSHTLTADTQGASVGDAGYEADYNPVTGLEVADAGNEGGGPGILAGMAVNIKTLGHGTYTNKTPFTVTAG